MLSKQQQGGQGRDPCPLLCTKATPLSAGNDPEGLFSFPAALRYPSLRQCFPVQLRDGSHSCQEKWQAKAGNKTEVLAEPWLGCSKVPKLGSLQQILQEKMEVRWGEKVLNLECTFLLILGRQEKHSLLERGTCEKILLLQGLRETQLSSALFRPPFSQLCTRLSIFGGK